MVEQISYTHSKQVLGDDLQVVFYDVTTIYFEVDNQDELRKAGFSKEGKSEPTNRFRTSNRQTRLPIGV